MTETVEKARNPLFARIYARVSPKAEEARGFAEHRRRMLAGLSGRVIEPGAGNGLNFPHYPPSVTEVVGVEPEQYLREIALATAAKASVAVRVVDGIAERLPAADESFDAGVASLVLCSVRDQRQALSELFRVIRPGGELRFHEHVRSKHPIGGRVHDALDLVWPHVAGGCHLSRDTQTAIEQAGFVIESCDPFPLHMTALDPPKPHILGVARRP